MAPIRRYLKEGMHVGLGSDVAAGSTENMFVAMRYAVVLDDKRLIHPQEMEVEQRLERMIYLADEREVYAKYVAGEKVSD